MIKIFGAIGMILLGTSTVHAADLPGTGFIVTKFNTGVQVQAVNSATVTKNEMTHGSANGHTSISGKAVLEIVMQVQGNLCSGSPDTVSVSSVVIGNNTSRLSLGTSYAQDAYDFGNYGCFAYGVDSTITLPLQLGIFVLDKPSYAQTFEIATIVPAYNSPTGRLENVLKTIKVTYTVDDGFKTVIE